MVIPKVGIVKIDSLILNKICKIFNNASMFFFFSLLFNISLSLIFHFTLSFPMSV